MRLRSTIIAAFTGVFLVGSVWAGSVLTPIGVDRVIDDVTDVVRPGAHAAADVGEGIELGADEALVGAAKVDIEPRPDDYDGVWVRDAEACTPATSGDVEGTLEHAPDLTLTWVENTNCIYMGGFGLGPSQPVLEWDTHDAASPVYDPDTNEVNMLGHGLWVRTFAISRGGQTIIASILDAEGWFAEYNRMCREAGPCGTHALGQRIAAEIGVDHPSLGITGDDFILATTHAHSAMDFIGGWGGVPGWYMKQVTEAILESARIAIETMVPATIEGGEVLARQYNSERRDLYYSAEDPTLSWIRAVDREGDTIVTVGTYAAHATSFGGSATRAHADYPVIFARRAEERFGGVGMMFQAGLGNMSSRGGWRIGAPLADLVPEVGQGTLVTSPDVKVGRHYWDQPVTNLPLLGLGGAGGFDRAFGGPAAVDVGRAAFYRCRSAAPVSVHVSVTAALVGDVRITSAPGEIFSNFSNTIMERVIRGQFPITALAMGQANDALGYLPQEFESDHKSRQGGGFIGGGFFDYEDAYSIDACFGEAALIHTLELLDGLLAP